MRITFRLPPGLQADWSAAYPCRLAMNYDLKDGRFKLIDYRVP